MKKLILAVAAIAFACAIIASPVLLVGSLQTVNNTTFTSHTNALSLNYPTPLQVAVTHGALANTNDVALTYQVTVDKVNWITFATVTMPNTNATTDVIQGYGYPVTNFFRVIVTTTNSQTLGISYGN